MADTDCSDADACRRELQNVKSRAVAKIRTLQDRVNELEKQLMEKRSPPESASSEEGGERFVRVDSPKLAAATAAREASLQLREQLLVQREQVLAAREETLQETTVAHAMSMSGSAVQWHGAVLSGLRRVRENLAQAAGE